MKVLIAVDESDIAKKAFMWYFENFHKEGNTIVVAHSKEQPDLPTIAFTPGGAAFPAAEIAAILQEHNKKLVDLENEYTMLCKNKKVDYKLIFETNNKKPGDIIIKNAEKVGAEMIVMGTRGLGMIKRAVLGSVSNYVVHHAKIPVLICPISD